MISSPRQKTKSRFMAGFNAGQRHAHPDKSVFGGVPEHYSLLGGAWSDDFIAGYKFGVQERRSGNITDNESCGARINFAWSIYGNGGDPPDVVLPK